MERKDRFAEVLPLTGLTYGTGPGWPKLRRVVTQRLPLNVSSRHREPCCFPAATSRLDEGRAETRSPQVNRLRPVNLAIETIELPAYDRGSCWRTGTLWRFCSSP